MSAKVQKRKTSATPQGGRPPELWRANSEKRNTKDAFRYSLIAFRFSLFVFFSSIVFLAYSLPSSGLFDSSVKLKVYERGVDGHPDRLIGFTPDHLKKGLKIPAVAPWFVRPMGAFGETQWKNLSSDITRQTVPGLDLSGRWDVEDQTLDWLGTLGPVRWLQLHHTRVTDQGMAQVSTLVHLEVLSVSPKTSDLGLTALAPLQHLKELDLRGSRVSEAALSHLKNFPRLAVLALNQKVTDQAGKMLASLTSLKDLDTSLTPMGDEGLRPLSALVLETFYAGPQVTDEGLAFIGQWTHLRRLDLSRTQITDGGLSSLEALTHLEALALTDTPITDAAMVPLSHLTALKTLELSGTQMTGAGLDFLARLPHLETLSLSWSALTPAEARSVAKFPHLKMLILAGTPVPPTVLAILQHEMQPVGHSGENISNAKPEASITAAMEASNKSFATKHAIPPALSNLKMRANVFQGLSGLRKIQRIETETSELNDIIPASQKQVPTQAESQPKDFLGDIDVRVKP